MREITDPAYFLMVLVTKEGVSVEDVKNDEMMRAGGCE